MSRRISLVAVAALWIANVAATSRAEFTPITGWDDQLFPSYLVATATIRLSDEEVEELDDEASELDVAAVESVGDEAELLGDEQGVLGVSLVAPRAGAEVKVTVECDSVLEPSVFRGALDEAGKTYDIFPRIAYKFAALAKHTQSSPVSVTFRVEIDGREEQQTATLTLRSINDCPFALVDEDGEVIDVSFMFAAYVNEQHPFVDKVLREALDEGVVRSFTGYQSNEPAEALRQVFALWTALSARDVRYSSITKSAAANSTVYSQHVRLLHESINNAQANCVDGSVLLASLLRKIGIEPALVIVPGHCYLAFALDADGENLVGLETTLLGAEPGDDAEDVAGIDEIIDPQWHEEPAWKTFCAALATANADLEKNAEQFADESAADYQIIPVAGARQMGVLPIAVSASEQFQAVYGNE